MPDIPDIPDIPFWIRISALVALMAVVAGADLWYSRGRSTRWKEYLFILLMGCAAAVFGSLTDFVTSSISPEYFIFCKELPAEGIRWNAMMLGLQAGFSAGAIAGALCLFIGTRKRAEANISSLSIAMLAWRPILLAVIFGAVIPLTCGWFDPFDFVEHFSRPLGPDRAKSLLTVWHVHLGVYLGLGAGLVWMIATIHRLSAKASALSS
jgi:hypothetical protein